ncbi:hypothetical protein JOE38_001154 [Clavibacter michiganensis]|uniref:hypothetical protein n=1 Tax=Clavibacter michiganensis TaxID=28447 RepID=UPI00195BD40A|nr:hypothetical protein [Clavibacter michiganensis]MBM7411331.1 hypothetical protein [Clavibacter michiganensis]
MLFFLLLCQLFGLPAVLAGTWEFITGFVMPAAAILSSGLLALWLQRRDHARQTAERHAEEAAAELQERRVRQSRLIEAAVATNSEITKVGYEFDMQRVLVLSGVAGTTLLDYQASGVPDAPVVGYWLSRKRLFALGYITKSGGSVTTGYEVQKYFMQVQSRMSFWQLGSLEASWFTLDAANLDLVNFPLEEEVRAFFGPETDASTASE